MTQTPNAGLKTTAWLAERLGLSLATIEKLRAAGSPDLPPALRIGRSIRYDPQLVEIWLQARMTGPQGVEHG